MNNIMRKIVVIFLLVIVCACTSGGPQIARDVEVISVDTDNMIEDASSFLDKIEIVPLETTDSSLFHKYQKVIYSKEMDLFAIYTREQVVFTFTGDGKFIDNSKRMEGQGPEEYYMVLDIKFNPYLKGIDMLNPYGTIYTYSPTFNLISKKKIASEYPLNYFMALNSDEYVFTYPDLWTEPEIAFVNMKTQQVSSANYIGAIAGGNSMDYECFHRVDSNYFFVPKGVNYYCYKIDIESKSLIPVLYLDFGKQEIKEEGLPGRGWGRRTKENEKKNEILKELDTRYRYLRNSNHIIPLVKFFNNDYVYIFMDKTNRAGLGSSYVFNRKTRKGYLKKGGTPFFMCPCFAITDNVLLAISPSDRVNDVVDSKLMSSDEIHKMETLKEDDNPVIIKYYLKK